MEREELQLDLFITPGNKRFVDELEARGISIRIEWEKEKDEHWQVSSWNSLRPTQKFIIASKKDPYNQAMFTHELLHIYLDEFHKSDVPLMEQFGIGSGLLGLVDSAQIQHISITFQNNLQHSKMLPYFLEAGFAEDQFIANYYEAQDLEQRISDLHLLADNKVLFCLFLGDLLAYLRFDVNQERRRLHKQQYDEVLKTMNPFLFERFETLFSDFESDRITLPQAETKLKELAIAFGG